MALLLSCESLSKAFGVRPLFSGITLHFADGERIGLIGPNGSGKSTLLKMIAGVEPVDAGTLTTRRGIRAAYLPQHDVFPPGLTVLQTAAEALAGTQGDEHEHEVAASIVLGKLGFQDFEQSTDVLSGGWRKRLALARVLLQKPDLLLLDEPTNHLDVEGIEWLEEVLADAPFAFLLVTHDRYVLENVTNRVVELNRAFAGGFLSINGSYSTFLEKRQEYLEAQASEERSVAGRVRREIEWLQRGAKARRTKAKGRIEEAHRLMGELAELRTRNAKRDAAAIEFAGSERKTRKLVELKGVTRAMGPRTLFRDVNLVLAPGTRLGLLGPNGSGKSTLIRLIAGVDQPDAGQIVRADGLKIVVFDQARGQLDRTETLRRALSPGGDNITYRGQSMHISGWARRFNFRTDQLDLPVGDLSGGEQARVLIARLMMHPADLLILDEPTNDLDIQTLEVLEESLEDFPGALVLVTHDRYMLDRVSTELLALDGKGGARQHADLAEWERARERAEADAKQAAKPVAAKESTPAKAGPPPGLRRLTYMEQREWEQMEAKVLAAEEELEERHRAMDDPATAADHVKMAAACKAYEVAQEKVQSLYARWEALEAKQQA